MNIYNIDNLCSTTLSDKKRYRKKNIKFWKYMNPFSCCLREIRQKRNLLQKDMADLIGYEQSYVSALETGAKGIPKIAFLNQVVNKLRLTEDEKRKLFIAAEKSRRSIKLPKRAPCEIFELCHELEQQLPMLSTIQLELITLALRLNHQENETVQPIPALRVSKGKGCREREELRM
ncbi:MAG: hypothetical protein CTY12_01885 [Methylotenera sp.]|nr:MAG: hypothetical protein CTY12_01885 [Methylotenera sp.]